MTRGSLVRLGLLLALAGLVLPVLSVGSELSQGSHLDTWSGWLLRAAGALLAVALLLWVLEKMGLRVSGARCIDCRRRVPYGRNLCADHLQARTFEARQRHHGRRGMGV